jgi:hypothetical protein
VAEKRTGAVSREWFVDARSPSRRMQVTRHPDRGLVVLSLWQGDRCTGTFRLRVGDSPALVHALVDGIWESLPPDPPPPLPRTGWLDRVRAKLRRRRPPVVRLVERRR